MAGNLRERPDALTFDAAHGCGNFLESVASDGAADLLPLQVRGTLEQWAMGQGSSRHTSSDHLLQTLATLLAIPDLALPVATHFRPLLPDLAARLLPLSSRSAGWAEPESHNALYVLATLLFPFPELYEHVKRLFVQCSQSSHTLSMEIQDSAEHRPILLLSIARVLFAAPSLGDMILRQLPSTYLQELYMGGSQVDAASKLMAIRIIATTHHLTEASRKELEQRFVGKPQLLPMSERAIADLGYHMDTGHDETAADVVLPGSLGRKSDIWVLAVEELKRRAAVQAHLQQFPSRFHVGEAPALPGFQENDLDRRVINVAGTLHLIATVDEQKRRRSTSATLVCAPSQRATLNCLAQALEQNVPVLLTGPPSSGKSYLLSQLAAILHPAASESDSPLVTLHLGDHSSLDAKALIGSYTSSTKNPGTFEWTEGALTRAVRSGKWLVLKDIDKAATEILGIVKPLIEALGPYKKIGNLPELDLGVRGKVRAGDSFRIFAIRSAQPLHKHAGRTHYPPASFLGSKHWSTIDSDPLQLDDVATILAGAFPRLAAQGNADALRRIVDSWSIIQRTSSFSSAVKRHSQGGTKRLPTLRDLMKWCHRIEAFADADAESSILADQRKKDRAFLEGAEIFAGSSLSLVFPDEEGRPDDWLASNPVLKVLAEAFDITAERAHFKALSEQRRVLAKGQRGKVEPAEERRSVLQIGRIALPRLGAKRDQLSSKTFAETQPANLLLERLAACVAYSEPTLLVGETGTGKTTTVQHLASHLGHQLIALNLSQQTEASDILGSFKPLEPRVPATELHNLWSDLFETTFSAKRNARFVESERKALQSGKWPRIVVLWKESIRMAQERHHRKMEQIRSNRSNPEEALQSGSAKSTKKRRTERGSTPSSSDSLDDEMERESALEAAWSSFEAQVSDFASQHASKQKAFVFTFVEGPLVKALREGHWILLDEINLAASETLDALAGLLGSPQSSLTLFERGDIEPIPRHPNFRVFACMNPATDVGKKDLPINLRSRFTELYVPSPDADLQALREIVDKYIGHLARAQREQSTIQDVAELYRAIRKLAADHLLADGANQRPHYSVRTLSRALVFASDQAGRFGLRRALWEGFLMAFAMLLEPSSAHKLRAVLDFHLLAKCANSKHAASFIPPRPRDAGDADYVQIGPFWLQAGRQPLEAGPEYILTPSVQDKLMMLSRGILARKSPILIQGPTSAGKTSAIEYLARRTGHSFVRINNHEHTDIQEYIGSYASDTDTGRLVFHEGLLVKALRQGDWIVLDELNLAPTDVLEALNRLLDDNRELIIPETGEIVRPHPHFMLFATQNPPGLYGGRKILSRAFRNRFIEIHFDDVPQPELETILTKRCAIPPSYAAKIVAVFVELQRRRQAGRVFDAKNAFVTLRDLFRWGGREADSYQQLADNGFMLIGERARRRDDKAVVKEVIQDIMRVKIDEKALYDMKDSGRNAAARHFGDDVVQAIIRACDAQGIVWTAAMSRLLCLVALSFKYDEPVLLVGETGAGKTSVCEVLSQALQHQLFSVSCHQNTDTADLLGGQRPLRNRAAMQGAARTAALKVISQLDNVAAQNQISAPNGGEMETLSLLLTQSLTALENENPLKAEVQDALLQIRQASALFEWRDGPLVEAMHSGNHLLLDEISLADDSVLERLNSVLEPGRTLVLAEKIGSSQKPGEALDAAQIRAAEGFQVVATMNPGGDYGKKELSPALRNRFTEIWVPQVDDRDDILAIFEPKWVDPKLRVYGPKILDFVDWFASQTGGKDQGGIGLRDLLAWVSFMNSAVQSGILSDDLAFAHGAMLALVDGIGAMAATTSMTTTGIKALHSRCCGKLSDIVGSGLASVVFDTTQASEIRNSSTQFSIGHFSIAKAAGASIREGEEFSFRAPTSASNALKVLRALYVPNKAILLEGSPGAGKTSLIGALAAATGNPLTRINLSDQTELTDLFGADLPLEGGGPGEFAWRDAAFLAAMQKGEWVLLDEMNLASQSVLEGLNSCLDHRGSVYIPELGRAFDKHPQFRLFAAQNPQAQGGGRKGLPKSFLNRFTKVHIDELQAHDILTICAHLYPAFSQPDLERMIEFNSRLHEEVMVKHSFGRQGSPWEFNLRDLMRWLVLVHSKLGLNWTHSPMDHLAALYLCRFRSAEDRKRAASVYSQIFQVAVDAETRPWPSVSPRYLQIGHSLLRRDGKSAQPLSQRAMVLPSHLPALEALSDCVQLQWLSILVGPSHSGKTTLVRLLAHLCGRPLEELNMNSSMDTMDVLGTFEQVDTTSRMRRTLERAEGLLQTLQQTVLLKPSGFALWQNALTAVDDALVELSGDGGKSFASQSVIAPLSAFATWTHLSKSQGGAFMSLIASIRDSDPTQFSARGRFEWHDGPLLRAMQEGSWLLLDSANLCSASVLDRLNSLFEPNGSLLLSERGIVDGEIPLIKPHPNFRLFMALDPQYGELSRAMRNRGLEISLCGRQDDSHLLRAVATYDTTPAPLELAATSIMEDSELVQVAHMAGIAKRLSSTYGATASSLEELLASALPLSSMPLMSHLLETASQDSLVQTYTYLHKLGIVKMQEECRVEWVLRHGIADDFLSTQANDIGSNPALWSKDLDAQQALRAGLRLALDSLRLVRLLQGSDELDPSTPSTIRQPALRTGGRAHANDSKPEHASYQEKRRSEIFELARVVQNTATQYAFQIAATHETVSLRNSLLALLHFVIFSVRKCVHEATFDFSSAHVVMGEIHGIRKELESHYPAVTADWPSTAHHIHRLTSGEAMREIWELGLPSHAFLESALPLERLLASLLRVRRRTNKDDVFATAVDIAATLSLPADHWSAAQKTELLSLTNQVVDKLKALLDEGQQESDSEDSRSSWCTTALSNVLLMLPSALRKQASADAFLSEVMTQMFDAPQYPASNIILARKLGWMARGSDGTVGKSFADFFAWAQPVLDSSQFDELLQPFMLQTTASLASSPRVAMTDLVNHRREALKFARLISVSQLASATPRQQALRDELVQFVALLKTSLDSEQGLATVDTSKARLVSSLDAAMDKLNAADSANGLCAMSLAYISVATVLLELYLPNVPLDPLAVLLTRERIAQSQVDEASAREVTWATLEASVTGRSESPMLVMLRHELQEATSRSRDARVKTALTREPDVARLSSFFSDVQAFTQQILHKSRTESLCDAILAPSGPDGSATAREESLQKSLQSLRQRLLVTYADMKDLCTPLVKVVDLFQVGFRSLLWSRSHALSSEKEIRHLKVVDALVQFPSAKASEALRACPLPIRIKKGAAHGSMAIPILLTVLCSIVEEVTEGTPVPLLLRNLTKIYEQLFVAWEVDRQADAQSAEAESSLYKSRENINIDVADDDEALESEFQSLFPEYGDIMDESARDPKTHNASQQQKSTYLLPTHCRDICAYHLSIFGCSHTRLPSHSSSLMMRRQELIKSFLSRSYGRNMSEAIDKSSAAFQLSTLATEAGLLVADEKATPNFYLDANVREASKATEIVSCLRARLYELIAEWPDQMVLQHIRDRCDAILALDSRSPVARILAALEQLLAHTQDWEGYASSSNSLAAHRTKISDQIIAWRRLELSGWATLLDAQAQEFRASVGDWWFQLFDATIRSMRSASSVGIDRGTEHLRSLVGLLDQFVRTSTLGDFAARLNLLRSFESYLGTLVVHAPAPDTIGMDRVQKVLFNVVAFYGQFANVVAESLNKQQNKIENEIRDFIKLASWKDVNIHALRQSAQKTHRRLHKSIRQFRAVLRQPVDPILAAASGAKEEAGKMITPAARLDGESLQPDVLTPLTDEDHLRRVLHTLPQDGRYELPAHLRNLSRTYDVLSSQLSVKLATVVSAAQATSLNDLAVSIVTQARDLAKATPLLAKENNKRLVKNLTNQKRKAWTDLLKELRRIGLTPFINPDVAASNQDLAAVFEISPLVRSRSHPCVEDLDHYFFRLLSCMPRMRESLHNAHVDISISELQRGVSYCEHAMSIIMKERARLAALQHQTYTLGAIISRLEHVATEEDQILTSQGVPIRSRVETACRMLDKIQATLGEIYSESGYHAELSPSKTVSLDSFKLSLQQRKQETASKLIQLRSLSQALQISSESVWTIKEREMYESSLAHAETVARELKLAAASMPALDALLVPASNWISDQHAAINALGSEASEGSSSREQETESHSHRLIDSVLLVAQNIGKLTLPDSESEQLRDKGIITDWLHLRAAGQSLRTADMSSQIQACLACLAFDPSISALTEVRKMLPFVVSYRTLLAKHIEASMQWQRSLLKLTYVLSTTLTSLAAQGFCKPPEQNESDDLEAKGEEQDLEGGTGLGDGSGAKDITDQLDEDENVEELEKNEDDNDGEKGETEHEKNAREAQDDLDGDLQDIDQAESQGQDADQGEEEQQPDDAVGDVDPLDPNAVDEKVWAGESGEQEQDTNGQDDANKDLEGQDGNEESVAKEDGAKTESAPQDKAGDRSEKTPISEQEQTSDVDSANGADQEEDEEDIQAEEDLGKESNGIGRKLDEEVQEGQNLDLDEDMKMSDDEKDEAHGSDALSDLDLDENQGGEEGDVEQKDADLEDLLKVDEKPNETDDLDHTDSEGEVERNPGENAVADSDEDAEMEEAARALDTQDLQPLNNTTENDAHGQRPDEPTGDSNEAGDTQASAQQARGTRGTEGKQSQQAPTKDENNRTQQNDGSEEVKADEENVTGQATQSGSRAAGDEDNPEAEAEAPDQASEPDANPVRSLGDALKEFRRNLAQIADASSSEQRSPEGEAMPEKGEVEHVLEDEDSEMQAVGAADTEDTEQKLGDRERLLEENEVDESSEAKPGVEPDDESGNEVPKLNPAPLPEMEGPDGGQGEDPSQRHGQALLPSDVNSEQQQRERERNMAGPNDDQNRLQHVEDVDASAADENEDLVDPFSENERDRQEQALSEEVARFRASEKNEDRLAQAADLWRGYMTLTSDLAFALCEQLRLILMPTLAARMNGDFRTGKRLNMRKIVPFIASDFAKDKIWLRRTKPSKREYQVLLALDDSRSMADNRSVHLAYQTLALVTGALTKLEVGDVSVCRFGQEVKTLHPFGKGSLGEANGAQILDELSFEQKSTNMVRLVENTLDTLRDARQTRPSSSGSSAADLWQLEIIISDGVCQADDFDRLRSLLRRATEERVMIVFIIVDSLQRGSQKDSHQRQHDNSVLSMQSVRYEVDPKTGKLDMKMERYMDQFPFTHYVILREAEALPDVLATTLRQWAEKIREGE